MRVKYPKTPHLPWSPGFKNDDTRFEHLDNLVGKYVVVTEKMDGENTTMYPDGLHARSLDSRHHASRDYVKALHARIRDAIPEGYRVCGENLYARHSIPYDNLKGYFQIFSMWDESNACLNWDETMMYARWMDVPTVPVLYKGVYEPHKVEDIWLALPHQSEGYVVRLHEAFSFADFRKNVAKYVRKNHIQSSEHWMTQAVVPNQLAAPLRRV